MNFFIADPEWGFWIIAYFYLGGIAAGSYFLAILIEWFGSEEDQPLARTAYYLAFPLVLLCTVCLIVDLNRQASERKRLLTERMIRGAGDFHGLHVVGDMARGFERTAGSLARCGANVRDHVLSAQPVR